VPALSPVVDGSPKRSCHAPKRPPHEVSKGPKKSSQILAALVQAKGPANVQIKCRSLSSNLLGWSALDLAGSYRLATAEASTLAFFPRLLFPLMVKFSMYLNGTTRNFTTMSRDTPRNVAKSATTT